MGNIKLNFENLEEALTHPTDQRIFAVAEALEQEWKIEKIHQLTKIDCWFLEKLANIISFMHQLEQLNSLELISKELMLEAKQKGFSDFQLARLIFNPSPTEIEKLQLKARNYRKKLGVVPVVKQIDTLAAEYPSATAYQYITYHGTENDLQEQRSGKSVIVLGSGAYRIGSSVEFDWCTVSAVSQIRKHGRCH